MPDSSPASSPSCSGPPRRRASLRHRPAAGAGRAARRRRRPGRHVRRRSRRCSTRRRSTRSRSSPSAGRTARWSSQALEAGKHVYSAVPMAITVEEIAAIIEAVQETGLTYMMGETSYYNPATVYARQTAGRGRLRPGLLRRGRLRARHGPRLLRRLPVQRRRGLEGHRQLPADALPDPLDRRRARRVADARGQRVARSASSTTAATVSSTRTVSQFGNDFSNTTALFEVAGGGIIRTNEFRRVGYPSHIRESRFRFFGTEASIEQLRRSPSGRTRQGVTDICEQVEPEPTMAPDDPSLASTSRPTCGTPSSPAMRPVHDTSRLPARVRRRPERARGQPPLPGRRLRRRGGHRYPAAGERVGGGPVHRCRHRRAPVGPAGRGRLAVPDFGDAPES